MSSDGPASASCDSRLSGLCITIPTPVPPALEPEEALASNPQARTVSTTRLSSEETSLPLPDVAVAPNRSRTSGADGLPPHTVHRPTLVATSTHASQRSSAGMRGLLLAETGGGLVELDPTGGGSGFKQGASIMPGLVTPRGGSCDAGDSRASALRVHPPSAERPARKSGHLSLPRPGLGRHATLLSRDVTPARHAAELKSLLGNSRSKIKSGAKALPPSYLPIREVPSDPDAMVVALEQGKSRARVELDILLDSETCVEGGYITGNLRVKIRKTHTPDDLAYMTDGKLRIVGFEGIPDNKNMHPFYQHVAPLSTITTSSHVLFSSGTDEEGYSQTREGLHVVPFAMKLPISEGVRVGAKGPFDNRSGVIVKYIVIASFKLKDITGLKHSIAHFYRSCEVYPFFHSSVILAPALHPLLSTTSRSVLFGGPGKVKLTANLHRNIWVAGQKCHVHIAVDNESKKSVKCLMLSLIRTITIFRSHPHLDVVSPADWGDPDACQTTTSRKLVAETKLEAGQPGLRGRVTEKGWWLGVGPGARSSFTHFLLIPPDALSIARSRLVEVTYSIRVGLIAGSLPSEVSVMLPLRIISHLSIDPPPSCPGPFNHLGVRARASLFPINTAHDPGPGPSRFSSSQQYASLNLRDFQNREGRSPDRLTTSCDEGETARNAFISPDAAMSDDHDGWHTPLQEPHVVRQIGSNNTCSGSSGNYFSSHVSTSSLSDVSGYARRSDREGGGGEGSIGGAAVDGDLTERLLDDLTMDILRFPDFNYDSSAALTLDHCTEQHSKASIGLPGLMGHDKTNGIRTISHATPRSEASHERFHGHRSSGNLEGHRPATASGIMHTGSSEGQEICHDTCTARSEQSESLRTKSKESSFSRRVDKLVATRRATAVSRSRRDASSGSTRTPLEVPFSKQSLVLAGGRASSVKSNQLHDRSLSPYAEKTDTPSQLGSVRSRVAELEGRATGVGGGKILRHIK